MPSPPIEVFLTTIASQPALRQRQEYILRILQVKKVPFTSYDLASNEDAKRLWKRKAPPNKQQLPGILVGGTFPGTYDEFEEAVEYDELDRFLRLKETWSVDEEDTTSLVVKPVGVPGASSPSQMTDHKPSFANQPSPLKEKSKSGEEVDAGTLLEDTSLQGIAVTDDELANLVKELGLEGDEAGDLVKGLSTTKEPTSERGPETAITEETRASDTSKDLFEESATEPQGSRITAVEVQPDRDLAKKQED
ncbi:hypothetical protein ACEPAH_757 [Sanghuangporus vaninii]